jgi:hypothetical protein
MAANPLSAIGYIHIALPVPAQMSHKPVLPDGRYHHFFTAAGKYTAELCRRPVNAGLRKNVRIYTVYQMAFLRWVKTVEFECCIRNSLTV